MKGAGIDRARFSPSYAIHPLLVIADEARHPMLRFSLQITPHLSYAEITKHAQECQDPIEKNRWLAIQLLSQPNLPMTTQQVAEVLNYSPDWVRKQVQRYNRLGAEGLINGRQRRRQKHFSRRK